MKSPFPGMDPYMERRWRSTHQKLIVYSADVLNERLNGTGLRAEIEERVVIGAPEADADDVYPDLYLHGRGEPKLGGNGTATPDGNGTATAVAPQRVTQRIRVPVEEPRPEPYLTIQDPQSNQVVTVVEFISPTNKLAGPGREQYLRKRRDVKAADVHFVEIDLVRAGRRTLPIEVARVPQARPEEATYLGWVRRGHWHYDVYPMPLRQPLPTVDVPLRPDRDDVPLPLQSLIEHVYASGYYNKNDYREPLRPPLGKNDAEWAATRLREAGLAPSAA